MTTYPPVPEPPEPERPGADQPASNEPASEPPAWDRPEVDSPAPEPFSGNPAPNDWGTDSERNPGGVAPEDPVPGAVPGGPSPEGSPPPAAPPLPPYPAAPQPGGAGYSPYAGGAVPPPPPPPPAYNGDGPLHGQQPRNGLGTAALVCGIIAIVLSFIPGLNAFTWPLGVLAIVFGAVGWSRANKGRATNKTIAITGLILGILSFFTFCLIYVIIGAGSGAMYYDAAPML